MEYIAGAGQPAEGCFLCAKPRQANDAENLVLARGEFAFVVLNRFPYNTGHLMVAPYRHIGDLTALPAEVSADLWRLTQRAVAALQREYRPDGFNLGMNLGRVAGAGLPDHLHLHVVPRWNGDTNFMPITADTKVLPEALGRTYARLRPYFDRSDGAPPDEPPP